MAGPRPHTTAFCVGRIMGRALPRGTPLEVPGLPALTYRPSAAQRERLRAVTRAKDRLADRFAPMREARLSLLGSDRQYFVLVRSDGAMLFRLATCTQADSPGPVLARTLAATRRGGVPPPAIRDHFRRLAGDGHGVGPHSRAAAQAKVVDQGRRVRVDESR